jgi:hypothetical protein
MSRDRNRVPTSEELERQGAVSPPGDKPASERRGILKRFFRAGRFRVSEDVAASKHIGTAPRQAFPGESKSGPTTSEGPATDQLPPKEQVTQQAGGPVRHRTIRIDQSVKDRRGLGRRPTD